MIDRSGQTDLPAGARCAACRYNLAGLSAGSACPECALPVEDSLKPGLLRFADRQWLGRVADGLRRQHAAMRWMLGATVGAVALGALLSLDSPVMLVALVAVPLAIITAANVQTFSTAPVALPGNVASRTRSRLILRVTAAAHAIGVPLGLAAPLVFPAFETAWHVARIGFVLNGAAMLVALLLVLEDLERRTVQWEPARVKLYLVALILILVTGSAGAVSAVFSWEPQRWRGGGLTVLLLVQIPLVGRVAAAVGDEVRATPGQASSTERRSGTARS